MSFKDTRFKKLERNVPNNEDTDDHYGKILNQQLAYDKILYSEVSIKLGENITLMEVKKIANVTDGTISGTYDNNPCLK